MESEAKQGKRFRQREGNQVKKYKLKRLIYILNLIERKNHILIQLKGKTVNSNDYFTGKLNHIPRKKRK